MVENGCAADIPHETSQQILPDAGLDVQQPQGYFDYLPENNGVLPQEGSSYGLAAMDTIQSHTPSSAHDIDKSHTDDFYNTGKYGTVLFSGDAVSGYAYSGVHRKKNQLKYMKSPNDYREEDQLQHMD